MSTTMDIDYNEPSRQYSRTGTYSIDALAARLVNDASFVDGGAQAYSGRPVVRVEDSYQNTTAAMDRSLMGKYNGVVAMACRPALPVVHEEIAEEHRPAKPRFLPTKRPGVAQSQLPRRTQVPKLGVATRRVVAKPAAVQNSSPCAMLPCISLPDALNPTLVNRRSSKSKDIPVCWCGVPFVRQNVLKYAKSKGIVMSSATNRDVIDFPNTWKRVKDRLYEKYKIGMGVKQVAGTNVSLLAFFSNFSLGTEKVTKDMILRMRLVMGELEYGVEMPLLWYADKRDAD